jgi:hypothetical protein
MEVDEEWTFKVSSDLDPLRKNFACAVRKGQSFFLSPAFTEDLDGTSFEVNIRQIKGNNFGPSQSNIIEKMKSKRSPRRLN